jgi:hypothetical protein
VKRNQALITALNDPRLSLKAKGLLAILFLVDEKLSATELPGLTRDGEIAIRSGLRELHEQGWLERKMVVRPGQTPRWQTRLKHG